MSESQSYCVSQERLEERLEESPQTGGPQTRTAHPRRPGRGVRRGLGLLAGLLALAVVGVLAYNAGTSYFALNGAWYGPLRVQVGPGRVSLEASMDLATYLNGSLSGSGKVCYHNPLGGGTTTVDLKVTGHRNANKVTIAFAASTSTLGIPVLSIAIGPELDLHGGFTTDPAKTPVAGTPLAGLLVNGAAMAVTLSGGNGAFPVALEMQRGVVAQFASACAALSSLGDRGDQGDQGDAGGARS
jgi:hypothetical protein